MLNRIIFASLALSLFLPIGVSAGTLDDIIKKKKIVIGVKYDYPPFGYQDEDGVIKGFDIRIANYIAKNLGVVPEFRKVTPRNRINLLLNGEVDLIAASMTRTPSREKQISFSKTYFVDGQAMLVRRDSLISGEKDLDGKIVGVIMGSTAEGYISSGNIKLKALTLFREYTDAAVALQEGKVDVIVADLSWCTLRQWASKGALITLKQTMTVEPLGLGVRKEDSDLLGKINQILMEMWKDGTYMEAYREYFGLSPAFDLLSTN